MGHVLEQACLYSTTKGIMYARVNYWQYKNSEAVRRGTTWEPVDWAVIVEERWEID